MKRTKNRGREASRWSYRAAIRRRRRWWRCSPVPPPLGREFLRSEKTLTLMLRFRKMEEAFFFFGSRCSVLRVGLGLGVRISVWLLCVSRVTRFGISEPEARDSRGLDLSTLNSKQLSFYLTSFSIFFIFFYHFIFLIFFLLLIFIWFGV